MSALIAPNIFRNEYRELSEEEKAKVAEIKEKAQELYQLIYVDANGRNARELSVAKTKLEECVLWAVKGLTGDNLTADVH